MHRRQRGRFGAQARGTEAYGLETEAEGEPYFYNAKIPTFVQGECRDQVYLDYVEPPPIFVQASAEPNLFGLCRAQPKMSRKRLLKTNI